MIQMLQSMLKKSPKQTNQTYQPVQQYHPAQKQLFGFDPNPNLMNNGVRSVNSGDPFRGRGNQRGFSQNSMPHQRYPFGPRGGANQGGFNQSMMNSPGRTNTRGMSGIGFGQRQGNQTTGYPQNQQAPKSGGLLQKLLSGNNKNSSTQTGANRSTQNFQSIGTGLTTTQTDFGDASNLGPSQSGSKIMGALDKIQGYLKIAESAAPMVEQYAPLT
ncbi:VrrA/YqfQ family protein [Bacillus sp. DJP31]|uniref:VrrA/YqfQ family protein n=1 Tax=Bacillus sp. DJP31 TaxID=3409789 RepID=UPI003BB66B5A